jgi:DNA-binding response OmpR family regulator
MRILIADDDRDLADALSELVRECGHEVVDKVTGGGLAVIQSFARHLPEVVILDILMPKFNGLTVSHALKSRKPDAKIVFVSGKVEEDHPMLINCNPAAYLHKPIRLEQLRSVLAGLEEKKPDSKVGQKPVQQGAAKPAAPATPEANAAPPAKGGKNAIVTI